MTASPKLIIVGLPRVKILNDLEKIIEWGGKQALVNVVKDKNDFGVYDRAENIEKAIHFGLPEYIEKHFGSKDTVLKSGGNDDLYLIENPDRTDHKGKFRKQRNQMSHLTPKKKKRR